MTLVLGNKRWAQKTVAFCTTTVWKVPTDIFLVLVSENFRLRNALLRYTGALAGQMASTALANGRSPVVERLARWILQMHSRLNSNYIETTHEVIAATLGVRRSGITDALHVLEGNHLIRSTRGRIEVMDREGLVRATGGAIEMETELKTAKSVSSQASVRCWQESRVP